MSQVERQFEEQRASNQSGLPHFESFQGHRESLTRLLLEQLSALGEATAAQAQVAPRLCVLGAGNAFDLDLARLLQHAEVHLVDIDADAVARARARVVGPERSRLHVHAPVDLSGMFGSLERWAQLQVTERELIAAPAAGAKAIAERLPGPFDVVVSTCLLTQLQLTLLSVLGDTHQLFVVLREFLTLTHLRTLAQLTKPGGRALLVTDLCEAAVFPPGRPRNEADLEPLMQELVAAGYVIHSAHPELLKLTLGDDPVLLRAFGPGELTKPWLWQNGPDLRFLVYALVMPRK